LKYSKPLVNLVRTLEVTTSNSFARPAPSVDVFNVCGFDQGFLNLFRSCFFSVIFRS